MIKRKGILITILQGGLPYSEYFSHIDTKLKFPVRTTIVSFVFVCIYGLLYLASTTAFNSIVTTAVLFLNITYVVPQGILLFSRGRSFLPMRYLRLGWLGYFCNWFSVLWIVMLGTTVCMPPNLPVTTANMNYTSPILVGLVSLIMLAWFLGGQKKFKGPKVDLEYLDTVNQQQPEARNSLSHGMRNSLSHSKKNSV